MSKPKQPTKPKKKPLLSFRKAFHSWSDKRKLAFIESLDPKEVLQLKYTSDFWLRDKQLVDKSNDWIVWLVKAGRGFGKTKLAAAWMKGCIERHEPYDGRHDIYAMVGPTHKDVKTVMIPALLAEYPPSYRSLITYNETSGYIKFPNAAIIYVYSSETEIRGPNIEKCWCDELSKWYRPDETYSVMANAVRIRNTQTLISTTPKKNIKLLRTLVSRSVIDSRYVLVNGSSFENLALSETYREELEKQRGTNLFRQEALGELLDDSEYGLFSEDVITRNVVQSDPIEWEKSRRILPYGVRLIRIVVAIDPAGTANPESDETGIIVVGSDSLGHGYVLEDASGRYSPNQWASKAVALYHKYQANYIIAETNFGKDMVENTIRTIDPSVAFKSVLATRGKLIRAEPIAAKYTQNFVHHVGEIQRFERLIDQMIYFTGAPSTTKHKDDRLDALIWGLFFLLIHEKPVYRHLINLPCF